MTCSFRHNMCKRWLYIFNLVYYYTFYFSYRVSIYFSKRSF